MHGRRSSHQALHPHDAAGPGSEREHGSVSPPGGKQSLNASSESAKIPPPPAPPRGILFVLPPRVLPEPSLRSPQNAF